MLQRLARLQLSHATQRYSLSLNWQTNQPLSVLQSVSFSVKMMYDWDATASPTMMCKSTLERGDQLSCR